MDKKENGVGDSLVECMFSAVVIVWAGAVILAGIAAGLWGMVFAANALRLLLGVFI